MHEFQVREEDVRHVLVEEWRGGDKVERYALGSVRGGGGEVSWVADLQCVEKWNKMDCGGLRGWRGDLVTYIFMASSCSFLGITSSM